jgi:outer membrane protein assembly factor BamB
LRFKHNNRRGEKTERNKKFSVVFLVLLLALLALLPAGQAVNAEVTATASNTDLMQYEWTTNRGNQEGTRFSAGPAPDKPNILWTASASGPEGYLGSWMGDGATVFNGKAFVIGDSVYAFDAFTGKLVWHTPINIGTMPLCGVTKIDDTTCFIFTTDGYQGFDIQTGQLLWEVTGIPGTPMPGSGDYFPDVFSSDLKLDFCPNYDYATRKGYIQAYDMSNSRVKPHLEWQYECNMPSEVLGYGDGKILCGTYMGFVYTLDAKTGSFIWQSTKQGLSGYTALYYDGKFYQSAASTTLTCYNAADGQIVWDSPQGGRAFFAFGGCAAYGKIFDKNMRVPQGFVGAWDANNGQMLWTQPAYYEISYLTPAVADGKLYITTSDNTPVAGTPGEPAAFECFDVNNGNVLWSVPLNIGGPSVAYGNLYGIAGGTLYCFGTSDWSSFRGSVETPGVGQTGPSDLSKAAWTFETGAAITSSPAVVDGKVFFGSNDKNLYCINAKDGIKVWSFPTKYMVLSSPAVSAGKVFTGADDGNIYALDAITGNQVWATKIYETPPKVLFMSTWQPRSSPLIVGNKLYVGALDGKVYCLNTGDGSKSWAYTTGGPIGGSPAYSNGVIYITSTDRNLYALDATTGNLKWKVETHSATTDWTQVFNFGTPTVAEGKVFVGGGVADTDAIHFLALNVADGSTAWRIILPGSNTQPVSAPTYYKGVLYLSEFMSASARNATTGELMWKQWLGHEIYSSAAVSNDLRGAKVYIGCNTYSITCLDATTGKPTSLYTTNGPVESSPALWDGVLFVTSFDGKLYCFNDWPMTTFSLYSDPSPAADSSNNIPATESAAPVAIATVDVTNYTFVIAISAATAIVACIIASAVILKRKQR